MFFANYVYRMAIRFEANELIWIAVGAWCFCWILENRHVRRNQTATPVNPVLTDRRPDVKKDI